jgi:hypothetical protein
MRILMLLREKVPVYGKNTLEDLYSVHFGPNRQGAGRLLQGLTVGFDFS